MGAQRQITDFPVYENYAILRNYLMQQTNYRTQAEITQDTGLTGTMVRKICNAYPCLAIGNGHGYRLAKYSSRSEIQDAAAVLMNRSIKMLTRAQALSGLLAR